MNDHINGKLMKKQINPLDIGFMKVERMLEPISGIGKTFFLMFVSNEMYLVTEASYANAEMFEYS